MAIIKFGYALVIVTFILMIWASLAGALEMRTESSHPPCLFQALCTCSKPAGDLGFVDCTNAPVLRVPATINSSKVYVLQMSHNKIRQLEPYFFQTTGLYKLSINDNPLEIIHDNAFIGLETSLWELELKNNLLIAVPSRALRYLQKLWKLDLSGNEISDISGDSWRGLETTLQHLILSDNSIGNIPPDAFSALLVLETLDLRGNHLSRIDGTVFRDGLHRLNKLLLADNQLSHIPYDEISPLRQLRYLDLSSNLIRSVLPQHELNGVRLSLDTLRLDANSINGLKPKSFRYFEVVNQTYFDGNPIKFIEEDAFRKAQIRRLSLRDCRLTDMSAAAFSGLENSLQMLDLAENNLTTLSRTMFHQFESLRVLNLRENKVYTMSPLDTYGGSSRLYSLDISGSRSSTLHLQDLRSMRSLRFLAVSRLMRRTLNYDDFLEYGVDLEELRIIGGGVTKIGGNAFENVRTIKSLDLSENEIEFIDRDAFQQLHSLTSLKIAHGLSQSIKVLPYKSLKALVELQHLDLSNNRLINVPDTSFYFLYKLKTLKLHDNAIDVFPKGTLQGDIHNQLEYITLSNNRLRQMSEHTFVDLRGLKEIALEDNQLELIQRRAFMSLENLKVISLRGNRIFDVAEESFQNLPSLKELDLSFNRLLTFKFTIFDQVGSGSSLKVNASYNEITHLPDSVTAGFLPARTQNANTVAVNVRVLDFSHNNITHIAPNYFRHAQHTLSELYLSYNRIQGVSREVFGSMSQLQYLDLSHNFILDLDYDCFRYTKNLQFVKISHNFINEIPPDVFRELQYLAQLDLSHNFIKSLADNLIPAPGFERLDLSFNEFTRIPTNALSLLALAALLELDLNHNHIPAVNVADLISKYRQGDPEWLEDDCIGECVYHTASRDQNKVFHQKKTLDQNSLYKSLVWLDLSSNFLVRVDGGAFAALPNLRHLDLSNNLPLSSDRGHAVFRGLERKLTHLSLRNSSLNTVPSLPFGRLISLDLAYNNLPSFPAETVANLTKLRKLDVSYNDLTAVPIATHSMLELRWFSLSGNPITALTNTSLFGVSAKLEYLDITKLTLRGLENGVLSKMSALRTLKISTYDRVYQFNIPRIISNNFGLKNLYVEVNDDGINLGKEMRGELPNKVSNITFTGRPLDYLADSVLQGVTSRNVRLNVERTSIKDIDEEVFWHPGSIRNITLDLRHNQLKRLTNPSAKNPGMPNRVFLLDIFLEGNPLDCDCRIGWVEAWERTRRQYSCLTTECLAQRTDVRMARCPENYNRTLSDVLKLDLECGFSISSIITPHNLMIAGLCVATLLYV